MGTRTWLDVAVRILEDRVGLYLEVPAADSREGYRDLEAFIETVQSPKLEERLWRAIRGRGAFRCFKDVLLDYPVERERWFKLRIDRVRRRVLDWLESEGIEAVHNAQFRAVARGACSASSSVDGSC